MERYDHFSHHHSLSFHKSLQGSQIICSGCNFSCSETPIYSCRPCKFFLHQQCFDAARSLLHPLLHPDHPLSLLPFPTYPSGSFICSLCNKSGSGFCFCCTTCDFDLHIHCAYNNNNNININKSIAISSDISCPPPLNDKIIHNAHPNHLLQYLSKPPYDVGLECSCDLCGTFCDSSSPLYHCDICGYDLHVGCVNLVEMVEREDHEHELSLLHVNPHESFECDVCRGIIEKKHCMYVCKSGCDYGMHVQCVSAIAKELEKNDPMMKNIEFQVEMFKVQSQIQVQQMALSSSRMATNGFFSDCRYI